MKHKIAFMGYPCNWDYIEFCKNPYINVYQTFVIINDGLKAAVDNQSPGCLYRIKVKCK